jgi:histidinol-phosphate/aromatic aminotransferase/cobyric acid decarboxylase-like protein
MPTPDFCVRSMSSPDEHPEIRKARLALQEVNKRIQEFEAEKQRLTEESELPGVKGLAAKNLLAQLESSPQKERLNAALITAEAAVRIASKKFGGGKVVALGSAAPKDSQGRIELPTDGAIWWMNRDLEEKQKRYGPKPKK